MSEQIPEAGGEATENVQFDPVAPAHTYLELQVVTQGQREFRCPFLRPRIELATEAELAFPEGSPWVAELEEDSVRLVNQENSESHVLSIGQSVQIQDRRIWLVDVRRAPVASLEAISEPFTGRVWHLKSQHTWVGRKGKRFNHVELDHPTISRSHATFLPDGPGRVSLLCESAGSATTVNGEPLEPGKTRRLGHGDLLGLGQLMFRLASLEGKGGEESLLSLCTLGTFEVTLGQDFGLGATILNEKGRWLLGMLAASWGEPHSVESVLEKFWPGIPTRRSRKNLSYTLSQLREGLGIEESNFETLLIRTTTTLQLNPKRLGSHDYVEVQKLTRSREAFSSEAALDRLLGLYRGGFMLACYEEWAESLRSKLDLDVTETLMATAEKALQANNRSVLKKAGEKLLSMDPLNEQAAMLLMEDHLKNAEPESAVALYESVTATLRSEDMEPDPELMKLYYRASMGI